MFWNNFIRGARSKGMQGAGLTDVGLRRTQNEDAIFLSDEAGLYLVADGMGGHAYGEIASALAIEIVSKRFIGSDKSLSGSEQDSEKSALALKEAIQEANRRIYLRSQEIGNSGENEGTWVGGMGTTLVALLLTPTIALIAHVGDSRAYRLRGSRLELLTRDHSLAEMAPDNQRASPPSSLKGGFKNIITRALGIGPDIEVDLRRETLQEDDLFLLCSDGLTNMVSDQRIEEILSSGVPLPSACETLVKEANQNGGRDNISCVLAKYS